MTLLAVQCNISTQIFVRCHTGAICVYLFLCICVFVIMYLHIFDCVVQYKHADICPLSRGRYLWRIAVSHRDRAGAIFRGISRKEGKRGNKPAALIQFGIIVISSLLLLQKFEFMRTRPNTVKTLGVKTGQNQDWLNSSNTNFL